MDLDALAHIFSSNEENLALNPRFEAGAVPLLKLPPTGAELWSLSPDSGAVSEGAIEGRWSLRLMGGDYVAVAVLPAGGPVSMSVAIGLASADARPTIVWYDALGAPFSAGGLSPSENLWPSASLYPTSDEAELGGGPRAALLIPDPDLFPSPGVFPGPTEGSPGPVSTAPVTVSVSATPPADAAWAACVLRSVGTSVESAMFDRVMVSATADPLPFFDGDSGACVWSGARYWSTSRRLGTASELEFMIEVAGPYWSSDSPLVTAKPNPVVPYS